MSRYEVSYSINGLYTPVTVALHEFKWVDNSSLKIRDLKTNTVYMFYKEDDFAEWMEARARYFQWYDTDSVLSNTSNATPEGTPKNPKLAWDPLEPLMLKAKEIINPPHYQDYITIDSSEMVCKLQWLEVMQYLPHYRNTDCFKAAVELQIRKYLDRSGKKDDELQESEKALWYLKFLVAYIKNGNKPIRVRDIDTILQS